MMHMGGACGAPTLGNSKPTDGDGYITMPYTCTRWHQPFWSPVKMRILLG
jgi:hypothetical protein